MSKSRGARQSPLRERKPSLAARILQGKGVKDESLDLFSWLRKNPNSVPSSKDNVTGQPGGVQGKTKHVANGKFGTDDLLSPEVGKNEFNWLMTPPVSPRNSNAQQSSSSTGPKEKGSSPKVRPRSVSASRPSRLSQETNNNSTVTNKMARSSSVTRSAVLTSSVSSNVRRPSIPNTMARSPSSGTLSANRSSPNAAKSSLATSPAAPTSRLPSSLTRSSSFRPPSLAKTRNPKLNQAPISERPNSSLIVTAQPPKTTASPRPLTPPRRAMSSAAQPSITVNRSSSLSRLPTQEMKKIKTAKPPERSVSNIGRQLIGARPSASVNQRPATSPVTTPKKNMVRSQFGENLGKSRLGNTSQGRKTGLPTDTRTLRTPVKQVPATDQKSISRTRSNRSLEANTKQIDTRQAGADLQKATIYPRSNSSRLAASKDRPEAMTRSSVKIVPTDDSTSSDRAISEGGSARLLSDVFESTRYDFLLKEDARNLSWLRGDDEMSLRCPSFHRFDLPPEPFAFGE